MVTEQENLYKNIKKKGQIKITSSSNETEEELSDWDHFSNNFMAINKVNLELIIKLELNYCDIIQLPEVFCNLINLEFLNLAHNKIKEIPPCLITGLNSLKVLNLSHNQIKNFDQEPKCLLKLKKLKLNNCGFKTVPKWILQFKSTSLEYFNYNSNTMESFTLRTDYNFHITKLKTIKMKNCTIMNDNIDYFTNIKTLQYLDLSNEDAMLLNKFLDINLLFYSPKWAAIRVIKLNNLKLSVFPEGIFWLATLQELYIATNSISYIPDGIEYLINLVILDISDNNLGVLPEGVEYLQNLKTLNVSLNQLDCLPKLPLNNLEVLDLYDNELNNFEGDFSTIECIDLEMNYFDTAKEQYYQCYLKKKNQLRHMCCIKRYDGPKVKDCRISDFDYDESPENSEEDCSDTEIRYETGTDYHDEEDWDQDITKIYRNPHITPSDDEWDGTFIIRKKVKKRIEMNSPLDDFYFGDDS